MKTDPRTQRALEGIITRLLTKMQLDKAIRLLTGMGCGLDSAAVKVLAQGYETQANQMLKAGRIGEAKRLDRRAHALNALIVHGPDPAKMVAETELPQGYTGKFLVMLITGGGFNQTVCLRSGDSWHREILNNTRAAIADLGFSDAQVDPLGGAYAGFDRDGSIVIWGSSDEFGCCDKQLAASLVARAYPGRSVTVKD
jgi:hypothetical protein